MDQRQQNEQYLKILSAFHYALGGLSALVACFPIIHLVVGLGMLGFGFIPIAAGGEEPTSFLPFFFPFSLVGLVFVFVAATIILLGWAYAICLIIAGRSLATRQRYTFCMVIAGIACAFAPFGTVLGVFTIVTLIQPAVKEMFQAGN